MQHVRPDRPSWPRCAHSPQLWPQPRVPPTRGFHSWRAAELASHSEAALATVRRLRWPLPRVSTVCTETRRVHDLAPRILRSEGSLSPVESHIELTVCVIFETHQIEYCVVRSKLSTLSIRGRFWIPCTHSSYVIRILKQLSHTVHRVICFVWLLGWRLVCA